MRLPALSLAVIVIAAPSLAQDAPIQNAIRKQIEAFQADDFNRAFTYASPMIKGIFRDADTFGTMVKRGYPMLTRPDRITMLDLRSIDGALWQKVMVTDAEGKTHILDYQMIEEASGWRINGVQIVPSPGVGA